MLTGLCCCLSQCHSATAMPRFRPVLTAEHIVGKVAKGALWTWTSRASVISSCVSLGDRVQIYIMILISIPTGVVETV